MNVRIGFTVDLSEVPHEAKRLLKGLLYNIQDDMSSLLNINDFNPHVIIEDIDKFRERLVKYDQQLEDCSNILQGYVDLKTSNPDPPTEESLANDIKKSMDEVSKLKTLIEEQQQNE